MSADGQEPHEIILSRGRQYIISGLYALITVMTFFFK